ncbi:MAG: hypothetical protein ACOCW9_02280 [Thermodesulfobacteriota bacterium]
MKSKIKQFLVLFAGLLAATAASAGNESTVPSPVAFLPEQVYTFEPVIEGTEVAHDFTLRNAGNETLYIENLKSG